MKDAQPARRPLVLVCADYYLPGYKAGGPIRTVSNLIEALSEDFEFRVVTRDRDLGAATPYPGVQVDGWNPVGKATVFYASPATMRPTGMRRLLRESPYDLLYLNSFFSPRLTVLPLLLRRIGALPRPPLIIASRGELAPAALALKPVRKRIYIQIAAALGLWDGAWWQATSALEREQVCGLLPVAPESVAVAPNPLAHLPAPISTGPRCPRPLRVVFFSRISPMKNLEFLLNAIAGVRSPVALSVCGPIGDTAYWDTCLKRARNLPSNVGFAYVGDLPPERVPAELARHHLFVLPTRGENFGHAIFESLAAGTPVIVSDRTPWFADAEGALTVLPLDTPDAWTAAIERWAGLDDRSLASLRRAARDAALRHLASSDAVASTRRLFLSALAGGSR